MGKCEHLHFFKNDQVNSIAFKLNRANALLFQIRNYVKMNTLKNTYSPILDSHLSQSCIVWAQNINKVMRSHSSEESTSNMNFRDQLFHSGMIPASRSMEFRRWQSKIIEFFFLLGFCLKR